MAIITESSRTKRTIDFAEKNLYFAFGRTTAWDSEFSPPYPQVTDTEVEELIFLSKVQEVKYITPSQTTSDIKFKDTDWTIQSYTEFADLYAAGVKYLYLSTLLTYDDYELTQFRQIGLLEDPLDLTPAICTASQYDDSEISDQGVLHYMDNRVVTNRQVNQTEKISIILEF